MAKKKSLKGDPNFIDDKMVNVPINEILKDSRTHKFLGILFILLATILLISFITYFKNWNTDQSEIKSFGDIWSGKIKVNNAFGTLGAYLSHLFIFKGFGIAAFILALPLYAIGLNLLLDKKIFSLKKILKNSIWLLFLICFLCALIFKSSIFPYGGKIGLMVESFLNSVIGGVGTLVTLLLLSFGYIMWRFNPKFSALKSNLSKWSEEEELNAALSPKNETNEKTEDTKKVKPKKETYDINEPLVIIDSKIKDELAIDEEDFEEVPMTLNLKNEKGFTTEETIFEENIKKEKQDALGPDLEIKSETDLTNIEEESAANNEGSFSLPYDPMQDLSKYQFPTIELLDNHGSEVIVQDAGELEKNKTQIVETLKNYDISIQKIFATIGPTVTLYEIVPAAGVRISKIKNLEDDIALSLAALGIRIIAPIPGKGTIGIEVPNLKKSIVSMRTLLSSEKFVKSNYALPIALGKKIDNENFIVDLASMPHLLMAGATGQGKSVGLNAILVSLLYKKHPSQLKFVLVDPKKVELSIYKTIERHFLAKLPGEDEPIITDTKKVINTLNALCIEMDNRYDLLKEAGCRNIKEYNEKFVARRLNPEKGHQFLPFIVLVVDEFADLIMTAGKEVEMPIARLAQLARAVGIHLIIATQRPSVNIITGTIKANFPARIAFKVSSKIDSRTILDAGGADQLIGKGDMLVSHNGEIVRLQCAFVDTPEVDRICDHISQQQAYPMAFLLPEFEGESEKDAKNFDSENKDALFNDAAKLIVGAQIGSTSLLQRRMKLGYNRAGRLMDQLEAAGIVGPNQGSKPRDVYIKTEMDLIEILEGF